MQQLPQTSNSTVAALEAKLETLLTWFADPTSGGWINPDVQYTFDEPHGYHARAGKVLNPPFDVATCPLALTISYLNIADHPGVPQVESSLKSLIGRVPDHVLNYLVLIEQRALGDSSRWAPYIQCLPNEDSLTTPLWFPENDFACISSTNLPRAASERLANLTEEWEHVQEIMCSLEWTNVREKYSMTQFKWASTIFSSRAFISTHLVPSLPTFPILFPVVDILNHSPTAKVLWNFTPLKDFTLRVLESVEAGEQISNNYAPKQNDELLMGYGFCVRDNPVEQLNLRMSKPSWNLDPDWCKPDLVPFDMGTDVEAFGRDLFNEPQFVRTKENLFGRYANLVPFFRGFPPCVLWHVYINALHKLGAEPDDLADELPNPGGRVITAMLRILHREMAERLAQLNHETNSPSFPENNKQYFAEIYRQGQAKIVFAIENELRTALQSILCTEIDSGITQNTFRARPCLITPEVAIQVFQAEFPHHAEELNMGLACLRNAEDLDESEAHDISTRIDPASRRPSSLKPDTLLWTFLLTIFFAATLDEAESLIYQWLQDLLNISGIDDEEVPGFNTVDGKDPDAKLYPVHCISHALDRAYVQMRKDGGPRHESNKDLFAWIKNLDHIATLKTHPRNLLARCYAEYTGLRIKVIAWAAWIAEEQGIDMVTDEEKGTVRTHLYFQPPKLGPGAEEWMYKDYAADIESRLPERKDFERLKHWRGHTSGGGA